MFSQAGSVIAAVIRIVAFAAFEALPRVAGRELRARPVERGVTAALRPALLQIGLDLFPLAAAVHHARFPAVAVRGTPVLVVGEVALRVRPLFVRRAPVRV